MFSRQEPSILRPAVDEAHREAVVSKTKKNNFAPSEDRTHDLQIMRLTRCLLRYRGYVQHINIRVQIISCFPLKI